MLFASSSRLGQLRQWRPVAGLPISESTRLRSLEADAALALDDWSDYFPPPAERPLAPGNENGRLVPPIFSAPDSFF